MATRGPGRSCGHPVLSSAGSDGGSGRVGGAGELEQASLLSQLARWQRDTGEPYTLVTFNYDLLLERARAIVYGAQFTPSTLAQYVVDGATSSSRMARSTGRRRQVAETRCAPATTQSSGSVTTPAR